MRLSARCRYGLRAAFDIAFHNQGRPTQVREMSKRQGVSPRMLEQVLGKLKAAGVVGAQRGRRGGYFLARPAHEVTLGDIVRACDGTLQLTVGQVQRGPAAPADAVWTEIDRKVRAVFDQATLADVVRQTDQAGTPRAAHAPVPMFSI
jgi:Rrf2 family transcriptional regulator, iron-sulfur cluster assembly transcription factor